MASGRGASLAVVALGMGFLVVATGGAPAWWEVATAAVALYLLEVALIGWRLLRESRRMLPTGGVARSWYATPDVLVLESGRGRTDFRGGSVRSYQRRGAVTFLRLGRTRTRGFVPSALLTGDDLAFMLSPAPVARASAAGSAAPPSGASATPATSATDAAGAAASVAELPFRLPVTTAVTREVQQAVIGRLWRRPSTYYFLGLAALLLGFAFVDDDGVSGAIGLVCLLLVVLRTVGSARLVSRMYRPGSVVRAGFSDSGLRLSTQDDFEDTWPLATIRRSVLGQRVVRLDFERGRASLFLPRALFPEADLERFPRSR